MSTPNPKRKLKWWTAVLVVPFAPVLLALTLLALVFYLAWTVCLHILLWSWWGVRGCDILFVYSDSPSGTTISNNKFCPTSECEP